MAIIWRNASIVGAACALFEGLLIYFADPGTNGWVFAQSLLFWFACGAVVYMANSGLSPLLHGVVLTLLLNIPWYIALAIAPGKLSHLPPMIVATIVLGLIIGFLKKKLKHASS